MAFDILGYRDQFKDVYGDTSLEDVALDAYNKGGFSNQYKDPVSWFKDSGIYDTIQDDLKQRKSKSSIETQDSSILRRGVADPLIGLAKGLVVGIPETVTGLLDSPTGGKVGQVVETGLKKVGINGFKGANKSFENLLSPETQEAQRKVAEAKGFIPTITTALSNPSSIIQTVMESLAPTFVGGRALGMALKVGEKGIAATERLRRGAIAGGLSEGLITTGQNLEQTRQETFDGSLTPEQIGINMLSGAATAAIGAVSGKLAAKLSLEDINTLMAGGGFTKSKDKILRRLFTGALQEGVLEELPQSMQEQIAQNLALNKPIFEGVSEAGAMGMLAGMAQSMGATSLGKAREQFLDRRDQVQPDNEPERKNIGADLVGFIHSGLRTGKLGKDDFTSDDAMAIIQRGYSDGVFDDNDIDKLKSVFPQLSDPINDFIAKKTITKVSETISPEVTEPERRVDQIMRKKIDDMTPEERAIALSTDSLTGLHNKRSYEEGERAPVQVSIDVDNLKYVNDNFGHDAGDMMLKKIGEAIDRAGGRDFSYHFHGDEFVMEGASQEELESVITQAKTILSDEGIDLNGNKYVPDFSYGFGSTLSEADQQMMENKRSRRANGELAQRGQKPLTFNPTDISIPTKGVTNVQQETENQEAAGTSTETITAQKEEKEVVAPVATPSKLDEMTNRVSNLQEYLKRKYPGVAINLATEIGKDRNGLNLSTLQIPEDQRNQGLGTKILTDIKNYADQHDLQIESSPRSEFAGFFDKQNDFSVTESGSYRRLPKSLQTKVTEAPTPAKTKVVKPTKTKKSAAAPIVSTETAVTPKHELPAGLKRAKPRYGYGSKKFGLTFESDIDKAAYITAQTTKSKSDALYLDFVKSATGMSESAIRAHGTQVKNAIKELAKNSEDGSTISVPKFQAAKVEMPKTDYSDLSDESKEKLMFFIHDKSHVLNPHLDKPLIKDLSKYSAPITGPLYRGMSDEEFKEIQDSIKTGKPISQILSFSKNIDAAKKFGKNIVTINNGYGFDYANYMTNVLADVRSRDAKEYEEIDGDYLAEVIAKESEILILPGSRFITNEDGSISVDNSKTSAIKTPKVETLKVETPKVETPKVETPKVETPKVETPKVEKPKVEKPKEPKVETPKAKKSKTESSKEERKRLIKERVEAAKKKMTPKQLHGTELEDETLKWLTENDPENTQSYDALDDAISLEDMEAGYDENNPFEDRETGRRSELKFDRYSKESQNPVSQITVDDVKKVFKGQEVIQPGGPNSPIYVRTNGGKYLTIENVNHISATDVDFEIAYGEKFDENEMQITGVYNAGTIRLTRNAASQWTLAHESMHFIEDVGILTDHEINLLKNHIINQVRDGKFKTANSKDVGGFEDRANFLADHMTKEKSQGLLGRMIDKVKDFIDKIYKAFGQSTIHSIQKEIETGEIYNREVAGFTGSESAELYTLREKIKPFFSQLDRVVNKKMGGKMPVEQLRKMLKGNGVTDAEIDNLIGGLSGTVTKQQVVDEIASNTIEYNDEILYGIDFERSDAALEYNALPKEVQDLWDQFEIDENIDRLNDGLKPLGYKATGHSYSDVSIYYIDETNITRPAAFSQYVEPGGTNYQEFFVTAPKSATNERPFIFNGKVTKRYDQWNDGHGQYSDIKNPIVRIRMNDRTIDGKSILFIEEMQGPSDTNQSKMPEYLRKRIYDIGVKRVIALAKEGGYDGIAWTTGQMQADRYDLSKHISAIYSLKMDDGQYRLELFGMDGDFIDVPTAHYSEDKLPDVVGKELARKIIEYHQENPELSTRKTDGAIGKFTGLDLKVGGEGLKTLYDRILPNLFKKYGKEGIQSIEGFGGKDYDQLPQNVQSYIRENYANDDIEEYDRGLNELGFIEKPSDYDINHVKFYSVNGVGSDQVQYIPITDKTPSSFPQYAVQKKGQPNQWTIDGPSRLDKFVRVFTDRFVDLKKVVGAISEVQGQLADAKDPALQQILYSAKVKNGIDDFMRDELRPFLRDIAKLNVTIDGLHEYILNRHAPEANAYIASINPKLQDGGSGVLTKDAQDYMKNLDPVTKLKYESLARTYDSMAQKNLQILVDNGLESQKTVNTWMAKYQHYAPLYRSDMEKNGGFGTGRGFTVVGSASKSRHGSTREVSNVIASIAEQRERYLTRAFKNNVDKAIVALAYQFPNSDFWSPAKPTVVDRISADPANKGKMVKVVDLSYMNDDNIVMARIPDPKTGEIVQQGVEFNMDNERARETVKALKNLDLDKLGIVLNYSAKVTRFISSVNTQYNPVFGLVNFVRDFQTAVLNLSTTPIAGKQTELIKGIFPALQTIYKDIRAERQGFKRNTNSQIERDWQDFRAHGGLVGYRDLYNTKEDRVKAMQSEMDKLSHGFTRKLGFMIADWVSDYNTTIESAVRLSAYSLGVKNGMSKDRAAAMAKNLTLDFNKKGQISMQAGALYAFFNASAQGVARIAETLTGPAGRKIMVGGIMVGILQAMMLGAAGLREDEPPEFVKERNLVIPTGSKSYITIPMPLGFHVLPNIGRIVAEYAMSGFKQPMKRFTDLFGMIVEATNPMGSSGWGLQTLAPTPVDPLVALAENKDWTGRTIYKENHDPLQPTPGFTRAKDSATGFSNGLAWAINKVSGGTEANPGLFSPTPDQIDYLGGQLGGGVVREVNKSIQAAMNLGSPDKLPAHKIPVLSRFYGETESSNQLSTRFFENIKRLNEHELEIKQLQKERKPLREYFTENPEARLVNMANSIDNNIDKLKSQKKLMKDRGADDLAIKRIDDLISIQMKRLNESIDKVTNAHK